MASRHIPMLFVQGSHYDIGYQMGKAFSDRVKHYYDFSSEWLDAFEKFASTSEGESFCNSLWTNCESRYPHYIEELKGISDGSGVPFHKVKLQHMERELATKLGLFHDIFEDAGSPMGCTDIILNSDSEKVICHNEDWIPSMRDYDLILCARISEYRAEDGRVFPEESFVVHTWPGLLMGMNSGFNKHGLVFSIDHLYPDNVMPTKTAELFLCRHMLSAKSIEQAVTILEDKGCGTALGFCVNLGHTASDLCCNIELAMNPDSDISNMSVVEVNQVPTENLNFGKGVNAHYNNYERLPTKGIVLKHCKGRKERMETELPVPTSVRSVLDSLGDSNSQETENNVFMDPAAGYNWGTIATGLFASFMTLHMPFIYFA